ncbi:MAG: enoyl-CoA hydratase/isomerase family protein [Rhodospirillales bacterium]|jgi:enoyl-CoA hydratase/carnithine racemase|nr:enoyl-CoA hydratase/isomerase family protein [Rhodospirillales bacterium]MBT4039347.1 enoyl-CoA hydratase/isomerase family protein [Rhodospirillales bacterium]MBT4626251.1 enoyl-CoA hydratase/isomerase family protein [Rhodospirillales bacterium]MBT5353080.1 enoyl-CoA hydratase/isomerase family protein [Rhodospirillales bacterium]MBT5520767.1 enoyl-CoA hydratase/isomerase family protein [Rhodospirillales bacterium]
MNELINVNHQDGTLVLTLNRPERKNALSRALLGELHQALTSEVRDDTSAVILHGSGGCFSAGGDLTELNGTIEDLAVDDAIEAVTTAIREAPVPVIAAIDGPCMGGAFDVAVTCDVRIAASNAIFQVPATRLGLLYSPKSVIRLRKLLGRDAIMSLLVLGERYDADAALDAGIVSSVVKSDSCLEAALAIAKWAGDNVRGAVDATKRLLNAMDSDSYDPEFWENERKKLLSSPERQEAVAKARARVVR